MTAADANVITYTVETIKRLRHARGLSLADVARVSGLAREAVARAERPETDPRASTLKAIAKGLGVPVGRLFEEKPRRGKKA